MDIKIVEIDSKLKTSGELFLSSYFVTLIKLVYSYCSLLFIEGRCLFLLLQIRSVHLGLIQDIRRSYAQAK